ncbi:response regulator transcription factor [Knoellia locipacati]|uniref:response regulator transcription factor n=1 Tax=Knoellia locipacati TaxID=882824 RepID=UPI001C9ABDEE|nr:response regulator transcription factor [Knoellia locipacati]
MCEDDPGIRSVVAQALSFAGHDVVTAHRGSEALTRLGRDSGVSVIVMDIGLPDSDGRDVVQALRSAGQPAPVIFLTALTDVHHRISSFHAGGDDHLGKPFDVRELIVRVEALGRRMSSPPLPAPAGLGNLSIDPTAHAISTGDDEVLLSPTEFRVLAAIASRPGEVVRRASVVAAAWSDGALVTDNTLDSFIRRVRRKLDEVGATVGIETVRGVGYRIR